MGLTMTANPDESCLICGEPDAVVVHETWSHTPSDARGWHLGDAPERQEAFCKDHLWEVLHNGISDGDSTSEVTSMVIWLPVSTDVRMQT